MITITIDNPIVEKIYKEDFHEDNEKFSQFILEVCTSQSDIEDLSYLQDELNSLEANIDSGYTHEELWSRLEQKYAH
jgi:hypothetical protein